MKNSLISAVLLLVLGFGLIAGHLPCRAAQENVRQPAKAEAHAGMSCHGSKAPAEALAWNDSSSTSAHDCCSDDQGVCRHACHMVADVGARAPRLAVQISTGVLVPPVYRSLPLHPQPLDHIPLA